MAIFAMADLHLPLSADKPMDIFGNRWQDYVNKIKKNWCAIVKDEDTVIVPGDISWAINIDDLDKDFEFIDSLPGKKLLGKGNHDYWWNTAAKMTKFFEEHQLTTLSLLHNNCLFYGDKAICGTRGWFYELDNQGTHNEKMLLREVGRLETSLKAAGEKEKLCFLHYPPIYQGYRCPEIMRVLSEYGVKECYYGHLHGASHRPAIEGTREGTLFSLVSGDFLGFKPKKICD